MKFSITIKNNEARAIEVPCASLVMWPSTGSMSLNPGESGSFVFSLRGSDTSRDVNTVYGWSIESGLDIEVSVSPAPGE